MSFLLLLFFCFLFRLCSRMLVVVFSLACSIRFCIMSRRVSMCMSIVLQCMSSLGGSYPWVICWSSVTCLVSDCVSLKSILIVPSSCSLGLTFILVIAL